MRRSRSSLLALSLLPLLALALACAVPSDASALARRQRRARLQDASASAPAAPTPAPTPYSDPCGGDPLCGNPVSIEYYQAHGWLLWIGFGVLMPLGIITSRHLQTVTKIWFYIHIGLMSLGTACVVAGCAIAFNSFGAIPGTPADDPAALHIRMGTAVFVMACLNFLMGFVRPHKGSNRRVVWYAFHFMFGTVAVALSWYVIFTGMNIFESNWPGSMDAPTDLSALKNWFTVTIVFIAFAYLFLGRWDYMLGQADPEPSIDGIKRFPSMYRFPVDSKVNSRASPEPASTRAGANTAPRDEESV